MTDVQMPLTAHLEELRWRLIKSLAAVAVAFVATYNLADPLFVFLTAPLQAQNPGQLIGTGVTEAFFTKMKVAFIAAIFVASPVLFFQAWKFVAPGLYDREKRYVRPFVFFATVFFLSGAAFCYWVVFPVGYQFFLGQFESIGVSPQIRISEYLTFSARMLLAFGATFELPVITFFLARMGLVTHKGMLGYSRYAVLIIFIVAGVLTPGPDVASQLLMAGPLLVLYAVSIGVAYMFNTVGVSGAEAHEAADDGTA
jgi:sec-independent protein translocase protein TatC